MPCNLFRVEGKPGSRPFGLLDTHTWWCISKKVHVYQVRSGNAFVSIEFRGCDGTCESRGREIDHRRLHPSIRAMVAYLITGS
jgi:hypothetical protein